MMDTITHTAEDQESGPLIPNPIPVHIRMSRTHFVLGNLGLVALLYAVATREIPLWAAVVVTAIAAVALAALAGFRTNRNNERYLNQRITELLPYFADRQAATPYAVQDRSAFLHVASPNPLFTVPSFVLALIFLYFTFDGVDDALKLQDWSGFFRWPTALVAAAAHGLLLLLVWASVNYTPALVRFDLARIRRDHDHANEQEEIVTRLGAEDHNDIQISQQQAHLESLHRRVETYTLESALLSALSFSSFLTIAIAEGRDKDNGYLESLRHVFAVNPDWRPLPFSFTLPGDITVDSFPLPPHNYFIDHAIALISLALLMCATTFLGVLVARLRFNDGYRDADSVLKAAERLNKKQDAASASGDQTRIDNYGVAIATMLEKCDHLQSGLDLMLTYMRFSRNAGIVFFIGALILCGLLFSMGIAVVIGVVMACAFLVGYIDDLVRSIRRRSVFNENGIGGLLKPFRRRQAPRDR